MDIVSNFFVISSAVKLWLRNWEQDLLCELPRDIVSKRRRSIENEDFADMSGETPEPPKMDTFFIMDMMRSDL